MDVDGFIETKDLGKVYTFGTVQVAALRSVTLSVARGRLVGVTGASGSGKSTFVNLLGGLDRPSSGSIRVDGRPISDLSKKELALYRRNTVGMIFQSFNLVNAYTALENVAFPLLFASVAKKERLRRAEELLHTVGLEARKDHRPTELSGGEQQRVAIARALVNQPQILLADEPTGNLDSKTSRQIVEILSELNKHHGLTIVMISHEQDLLREFADEIVSLQDGVVVGHEDTLSCLHACFACLFARLKRKVPHSRSSFRTSCRRLFQGMDGFFGQPGRIPQRLSNILRLQVGIIPDDLLRAHSVSDQIDNQGNGDAHAANTGSAAHHIWIERDAIELQHRTSPRLQPCSPWQYNPSLS